MKFAQYLSYLRDKRGLTKTQVAERMGVTPGYYINLENENTRPPTPDRCQQIANILNLDDAERKKFLELAYEGRLKDKDIAFQTAIDGVPGSLKPAIIDEENEKKKYISDLNQWAHKSSFHKVRTLIEFLKSNGS